MLPFNIEEHTISDNTILTIIDIMQIDEEAKSILDENFVLICEGDSGAGLSTVKTHVKNLYSTKNEEWIMGATAEFFIHLYIRLTGFKQECLFLNLEENSIKKGYNLIGIGEMGICNTTPSSAIISVIDNCDPEDVTGIGAGLKKERVKFKADTIRKSIELNKPNPEDAIDILSKVGGFEIGGMAGVILGCSANRIPVVLDGFISYAAALLAYKINLKTREYMIASHSSAEPGTQRALKILNLEPVLNMGMRLGEGSGAALAFNIIEAANYTYENMATFDEVDMGR